MLATRVSKIVASALLAAGGMTLSVTAVHHVQRIPGVVEAEQGTGTTTAVETPDDVTWGK
ncbi:hypothetical protein [Streptomyces sp. MK5]|uniref:hypothetical protein n=1 Tax=Streptomyces sp. MK5 TaxID=3064253 RepID=UPI0027425AA4|nr:hypothetical protein [Streptomyces sp. MK5]